MMIKSNYPINEEALNDFKNLMQEYDILNSIEVPYDCPRQKYYLRDTITGKCRFCNKKFPEVKFSSIAHAIPEFMGNRSFISKFECTNCNQYFSQFESEFANFMLPYNVFGGVKNKGNKFPKYKQDITVYHEKENELKINNFPYEISPDEKKIKMELNVPTYIPDYLYRALIKIGLTIIPSDKTESYRNTIEWLMDLNASTVFPGGMYYSIFPFSNPLNEIRCVVLSKKKTILKRQKLY